MKKSDKPILKHIPDFLDYCEVEKGLSDKTQENYQRYLQKFISWLEKAIEKLSREQKQVVLMRLHGELPFKEIARVVNCPLNTVLGRMHYAVQNLQKMVKKEYGGELQNVLS